MDENETTQLEKLKKELSYLKEQYTSLESMFQMTTVHLKKVQDDLYASKKELVEINTDLTDSINYAKLIQNAFTVQEQELKKTFPNSFIFDSPKYVVSGDFIWSCDKNGKTYLALGDCTGHGVPGAMLSIFIVNMLDQISNSTSNTSPADIIEKLDKRVQKYLYENSSKLNDSVEIAVLEYDAKNQKLLFAGAKRPLIRIREGDVKFFKGSNNILGNSLSKFSFAENNELYVQKGDLIYLFSDGIVDQFGGSKNKKFLTKRFLVLLTEIASLTIACQEEKIKAAFIDWKGDNDQIDDILVMGIRI